MTWKRYLGRGTGFAIARIVLVFLILFGVTFLHLFAIHALASSWAIVNSANATVPASERWRLRASCVIIRMPTRPKDLGGSIFWIIVMFVYYINMLTKVYPHERWHSSSFIYRFVLGCVLRHEDPPSCDDYERQLAVR